MPDTPVQYLRCVEPLEDPGVDHLLQVGEIRVAGSGLQDCLQQRPWAPGELAIVVNDFGQHDLENLIVSPSLLVTTFCRN